MDMSQQEEWTAELNDEKFTGPNRESVEQQVVAYMRKTPAVPNSRLYIYKSGSKKIPFGCKE